SRHVMPLGDPSSRRRFHPPACYHPADIIPHWHPSACEVSSTPTDDIGSDLLAHCGVVVVGVAYRALVPLGWRASEAFTPELAQLAAHIFRHPSRPFVFVPGRRHNKRVDRTAR